jgi:hypothetical protein
MGNWTDAPDASDPVVVGLVRRFRAAPLGPYDPELLAFLLRFRAVPAQGKHVLVRLDASNAWTLARMGGRGKPVTMIGGHYEDPAEAEWAVFSSRWLDLYGWRPEQVLE